MNRLLLLMLGLCGWHRAYGQTIRRDMSLLPMPPRDPRPLRPLMTKRQSDESRRWHLERAEAKRIRRAYWREELNRMSREANRAWRGGAA